ncbi:MAG: phospholipid carrier-dependent glycosyltransferase [Patescibacteria group bacterium]
MNKYKSCALLILLFFMSFYSLFGIGHFGGDGYQDYLTAESIVLDHNLSLNDRPEDIDELQYIKSFGIKGTDNKVYSSRTGLGVPIILVIFYFFGHVASFLFKDLPHDFITMFFVSFANPVICALCCFFVFVIAKKLKFSLQISAILAFIYGLSTMLPVYARTAFNEPAIGLFLLISIYFILDYKSSLNVRCLILSGLAMAYSFFIKPSSLIFLVALLPYIMWISFDLKINSLNKIKHFFFYVVSLLVPVILICIYNQIIYGDYLKFGGQEAFKLGKRIMGSTHLLKGFYYYMFSTGKSFILFNIPIVLAFIGAYKAWQERKKETVLFLLIFFVNLLFFVKFFRRGSLFSWGPRYLLPSLPFLIFFIGDYCQNYRKLISKVALFVLSVIGFLIMLPCLFINQSKFYFFIIEKLRLDEYMINFIPDLSPILGAWNMLISRIYLNLKGIDIPFIYNPDYRLVNPISASMLDYNNFDFWFLKIIKYKTDYNFIISLLVLSLVSLILLSSSIIIKILINKNNSLDNY